MEIVLTTYQWGVLFALLLTVTMALIEYFEGVPHQLGELLFIVVLFTLTSWFGVIIMGFGVLSYLLAFLNNVTIQRRQK